MLACVCERERECVCVCACACVCVCVCVCVSVCMCVFNSVLYVCARAFMSVSMSSCLSTQLNVVRRFCPRSIH